MSEWNGKVGDVVKPVEDYEIKHSSQIGFKGGKMPLRGSVSIKHSYQVVLLDVGQEECIAYLLDTWLRRYDNLVFRIPTKVLIEWHTWWREEEEKEKNHRDVWGKIIEENTKQQEMYRAKWL